MNPKRADLGEPLALVIQDHLAALADAIARKIAKATHAHVVSPGHAHGNLAEAEVVARAGDQMHDFSVRVELTQYLSLKGSLHYSSSSTEGGKEREKSYEFELAGSARPEHFIDQMVGAALEQYEGKAVKLSSAARVLERFRRTAAQTGLTPVAKATAKTAAEKLAPAAHEFMYAVEKLNQWAHVVSKVCESAPEESKARQDFEWRARQLAQLVSKDSFDVWALVYAAHDVADKL